MRELNMMDEYDDLTLTELVKLATRKMNTNGMKYFELEEVVELLNNIVKGYEELEKENDELRSKITKLKLAERAEKDFEGIEEWASGGH